MIASSKYSTFKINAAQRHHQEFFKSTREGKHQERIVHTFPMACFEVTCIAYCCIKQTVFKSEIICS